jgi:hypothetical protein
MKTFVVFISPFLRACRYSRVEAVFKEKRGEWEPMLGRAPKNSYPPQKTRMPMNVSPVIKKWSNGATNRKKESIRGRGKEGVGAQELTLAE